MLKLMMVDIWVVRDYSDYWKLAVIKNLVSQDFLEQLD